MPEYHKPVLLNETLAFLQPKATGVYIDATLGGAGHSFEILKSSAPDGVLIGIDRDSQAIEHAGSVLKDFGDRAKLYQANFGDIERVMADAGIDSVDGILFDLGVSSHQLDAARGFSFLRNEDLDMRMNTAENTPSAKQIVNTYSEFDLADIIWKYGEERYSRRVAGAIVYARQSKPINTTAELADIVAGALRSRYRGQDIHPATRTFQAIRIETNHELDAIEKALPAAIKALKPGGRICVISFHSLEDRIVKSTFRKYSGYCECSKRMPACTCGAVDMLKIINRKPIVPGEEEVADNPRSRSSKLRCAERII